MTPLAFFDIETTGRDQIEAYEPDFEAPGNYKDPEKIAANIAEQRAKWREKAALSALTGEIVAIGVLLPNTGVAIMSADVLPGGERELLEGFAKLVRDSGMGAAFKLCGFNIHDFDLPFIVQRMLALNVPVPPGLLPNGHSRFFWPSHFIDLRAVWACGLHQAPGSLAKVGRLLDCGSYESSGKDFARLWRNPETREAARIHLVTQLEICRRLARRFGLAPA